jgi:type II secretory pathway component PulJ
MEAHVDWKTSETEMDLNLGQQLTAIQAQLGQIQRDIAAQNRRLAEMEELKDDLVLILKDMMQTAVVELDDVTPFVQTGDFLNLVKKLLRNTNRISESLGKLESAADFFADAKPIGNDLFHRFIHKLDELERKGYFKVGADLQSTTDALVQTLAARDVLPAIGRSLRVVGESDPDEITPYSIWKVYRATKTPEMQRLMGVVMTFLKALAKEMDTPHAESA